MQSLTRLAPLILWLWPLVAGAGPPFLTDDPDPIPYHSFEAIPFYSLDRAFDGSTISGPGVDFNYGIAPDMHLNFGPGFVRELPSRGASNYGLGDTRIALKWRFLDESSALPEIAIYPAVELPTGNATKGLGNGRVWYQFPIWFEKNWDKWTSYGGGGWTLNRAPGQRDYFYGGWLVQRAVNDRLFLGGELYSQGADAAGSAGYTALNVGGGYAFNRNASLIFSGGHSFAGASHALLYLGVDFTW